MLLWKLMCNLTTVKLVSIILRNMIGLMTLMIVPMLLPWSVALFDKTTQCQYEKKMRRLEERLDRMEERHAMEIRNLKVQVHEKDLAMLNMMEKMGDDLSIGLYQFHEYGCYGSNLTLECSNGTEIQLMKAEYGENSFECAEDCCAPHPYDCSEVVAQVDPSEWLELLYLCSNQTECTYFFRGSTFVHDCAPGQPVDYMSIYFICQPVKLSPPIGFSAYATDDISYASENAIVLFNGVISNFGGFYDNTSSIFWCPVHGVYMVFVNVMGSTSKTSNVEIMVDDRAVGRARADADSSNQNKGSGFVLVDCSIGETIWIKNNYAGQIVYAGERQATFSAFLMHMYE